MGLISSKFFKFDSKSSKCNEEKKTEDIATQTTEIQDVRSPTDDIIRTPIMVEKSTSEMFNKVELHSVPLRTKLLKSLKLDPRSPTAGIYRTPILVEDSGSEKAINDNCDSPISIYSSNLDGSIVQDVMTPLEPSVNVSGFQVMREIDELDITLEPEIGKIHKTLKVAEQPTTCEGRRLLDEIISSEEENLKNVKNNHPNDLKSELKVLEKNMINDSKGRSRPPLTNITLSSNSSNQISSGGKWFSRNKALVEYGSENSSSPKAKHLAQWDQNNTFII